MLIKISGVTKGKRESSFKGIAGKLQISNLTYDTLSWIDLVNKSSSDIYSILFDMQPIMLCI